MNPLSFIISLKRKPVDIRQVINFTNPDEINNIVKNKGKIRKAVNYLQKEGNKILKDLPKGDTVEITMHKKTSIDGNYGGLTLDYKPADKDTKKILDVMKSSESIYSNYTKWIDGILIGKMEAAWKTEISGLAGESTTKYGIKDLKETLLQLVSLVQKSKYLRVS